MSEHCEDCGEELAPEDETEGICKNCKIARDSKNLKENEEFIDPAIA